MSSSPLSKKSSNAPSPGTDLFGAPQERHYQGASQQITASDSKPLGLVWIDCPYPIVAIGLSRCLEGLANIHVGRQAPPTSPSAAILDPGTAEGLSEGLAHIREVNPDIAAILVFGLNMDLALARAAIQAGAQGFIHAGMQPGQISRAVEVATKGELVAPRQLLAYLLANEEPVSLNPLTSRQREILTLVAEGLTNAQIAERLYLSESSIKQHLRHAYKLMGVKNRTEAARLFQSAKA